jgi:hypothetical protein
MQGICQRKDGGQDSQGDREQEFPGEARKRLPPLEGQDPLDEVHVHGIDGIEQFIVDAKDEGHGPARNAGHHIRGAHREPARSDPEIVDNRPVIDPVFFHSNHASLLMSVFTQRAGIIPCFMGTARSGLASHRSGGPKYYRWRKAQVQGSKRQEEPSAPHPDQMTGRKSQNAQAEAQDQTPKTAAAHQMIERAVKQCNEEGEEQGGKGHGMFLSLRGGIRPTNSNPLSIVKIASSLRSSQ